MKKILLILLILVLAFIWGNSCMSVAESQAESGQVMNFIEPFLEIFVGKGNVTDHLVRKLAHFTEFAALGSILSLLLPLTWKGRLHGAFCGLMAGFIDETIQIFSDRGDQISDVWLDFAGALFGVAVFSLLWLLVRWIKLRRSRNSGKCTE